MQKESLRTRGSGGLYSRYFAGGFALWRCRNSIRRYSAAPKREFRSQFPLFPLDSKKLSPVCSSLPQFALVCPIYAQSQKLPRIHGVKSGSRISGRGRALLRDHDGSRPMGEAPCVIMERGKPMSCPWFEELEHRPVRGPDAEAGAGRCSAPVRYSKRFLRSFFR